MAHDVEAEKIGVSTLLHLDPSKKYPNQSFVPNEGSTICAAVPVRVRTFALAHAMEPGRKAVSEFLDFERQKYLSHNFKVMANSIKGRSIQETVSCLEELSIDRSILTASLGGPVQKGLFDDWVRRRLSEESLMGAASPWRALAVSPVKTPMQHRSVVDPTELDSPFSASS